MNLADCRSLDELKFFVKAKNVYAVNFHYKEVLEFDPKLNGITFEVRKNPLSFYLHYSGGMASYDNVFTSKAEAQQYLSLNMKKFVQRTLNDH